MFRMKNKLLKKGDLKGLIKNSGTYTLIFMCLVAIAFFGFCTPQLDNGLSGPAASVGGDEILSVEFSRAYGRISEDLRQRQGENYDPVRLQVARRTIDTLIGSRVLEREAESLGLMASDTEIQKMILDFAVAKDSNGRFSPEKFKTFLRRNSFTERTFEDEIRRERAVQKLSRFVQKTGFMSTPAAKLEHELRETKANVEFLKFSPAKQKVSPSSEEIAQFASSEDNLGDIESYYLSHSSEFNQAETIKARHILISHKGARMASSSAEKKSPEAAKKQAEELLAKLKQGADFVKLAKSTTDEPSGKNKGGDLGYFARDAMVKEFSDRAFALAPGQLSDVVQTPFGFHIIKVEDKRPAKNISLDEAKTTIAQKILKTRRGTQLAEEGSEKVLSALKAGQDVSKLLKEQSLSWQETGPFALWRTNSYFGGGGVYIPRLGNKPELVEGVFALQEKGAVSEQVIPSGKDFYILRLKGFDKATSTSKNADEIKSLAETEAFFSARKHMSELEQSARKRLEDDGAIYLNPAYLAIDQPRR